MDTGETSRPAARIVIFSPQAELEQAAAPAALHSPDREVVRAPTGYEAAAELLAEPAAALVVDLRALAPRDLRLLEIARARRVEVLAVGPLPAGRSADELSGVRLIARAELDEALAALLEQRADALTQEDQAPAPGGAAPEADEGKGFQAPPGAPTHILTADEVAELLAVSEQPPAADETHGGSANEAAEGESGNGARPRPPPAAHAPDVNGLAGAYLRVTAQEAAARQRARADRRRRGRRTPPLAEVRPGDEPLTPEDLAALLEDEA